MAIYREKNQSISVLWQQIATPAHPRSLKKIHNCNFLATIHSLVSYQIYATNPEVLFFQISVFFATFTTSRRNASLPPHVPFLWCPQQPPGQQHVYEPKQVAFLLHSIRISHQSELAKRKVCHTACQRKLFWFVIKIWDIIFQFGQLSQQILQFEAVIEQVIVFIKHAAGSKHRQPPTQQDNISKRIMNRGTCKCAEGAELGSRRNFDYPFRSTAVYGIINSFAKYNIWLRGRDPGELGEQPSVCRYLNLQGGSRRCCQQL